MFILCLQLVYTLFTGSSHSNGILWVYSRGGQRTGRERRTG
nr:MAG TPA: hypothetical protein [Caudoviricetes sp.]